jgi:hypothetical protein
VPNVLWVSSVDRREMALTMVEVTFATPERRFASLR